MAEEVRIDLKSTADTSGAKQMEAAIGGLAGKTQGAADGLERAGKGSKDMARGLGDGAAAGNAAVAAMSQLSTATQGGASGMLALARGAFAAGVSLKAVLASMGPVGAIAAVIGVALGVMSMAFKKSEEATESARKKLEELNKTKLENLGTEIGKITTGANEMKSALDAANASAERIADAKLADQLAANKASDLSPESKERNEVSIRRRREDEKRAAAQKVLDDKAQIDAEAYAETQRVANRELSTVDDLSAKKARLDKAQKDLQSAQVAIQTGGEGGLGAGLADYEKASAAQAEFEAARKDAGDSITENLDAAIDRAKKAVAAIGGAASTAIKTQNRADLERLTQAGENPYIAGTRNSENRIQAGKTPAEQAAFDREKARISALPASVLDNQVASGLYTNQAAYEAVRGDKNWQRYSNKPTTAGSGSTLTRGDQSFTGGAGGITEQAKSVTDSAASAEASAAGAKDALGKIAEGSKQIAETQESLTTQIATTSSELASSLAQAVSLGGQNVAAYAELSQTVRGLAQEVRTMSSRLSAERAKK